MKILQIHNRYRYHGGEDVVLKMEYELLTEHGHQVEQWVEDSRTIDNMGFAEKLITAVQSIWSFSAYRKAQKKIAAFKPDVVHVHNVVPFISPSVFTACKRAKVPAVQTLHNFRYFCSPGIFYRNNKICEKCLNSIFPLHGILGKCYRSSYVQSAVMAVYIWIHRIFNTYNRNVSSFITLTEFSRKKFIEGGIDPDKIIVKPNFVSEPFVLGQHQGGFALFAGRLAPEKGLKTLIEAWSHLKRPMKLKIAGTGELADYIVKKTNQDILYLGKKDSKEIRQLMNDAELLIVPSEWYEGFPLVMAEAFSTGLPVIGSRLGNIENILAQGNFGLSFIPGDSQDLAAKVEEFMDIKNQKSLLPSSILKEAEAKFSSQINYQQLISVYQMVQPI